MGTKTDGSFDEVTIDSEVTDYFDIWNHVTASSLVDMNNLFVFGPSFGGAITIIAKVTYNLQPKAAILEYPALSFTDETPAHLKDIGVPSTLIESINPYIGDFEEKYLSKFDINTLILHGSNDTIVGILVSENAIKYIPNATLKVIDGAGHTFGIKENKNVAWPAIVDFLISNYD